MVIPSINVSNFNDAQNQVHLAESFLAPPEGWIHIDVSDGKFTAHTSWGDSAEFQSLQTSLNAEVHLMVANPESAVEPWLHAGAKRVIVHVQEMSDPSGLLELCKKYGAEVMLSADPSQPIDRLFPYKNAFSYFQILTVLPGPSGQKPASNTEEKTRALRERIPTATIEIDGGVSPENAGPLIRAGADILVSGHHIFGSPDPAYAYKTLLEVK